MYENAEYLGDEVYAQMITDNKTLMITIGHHAIDSGCHLHTDEAFLDEPTLKSLVKYINKHYPEIIKEIRDA